MVFSSTSSSSPAVDEGDRPLSSIISTVHPDIFRTHILTRLDGLSLASAACASSQLQALSTEDKLWRDVCSSTWPSVNDPRVSNVISTFPSGHRSFFSDSFPLLDYKLRPKQERVSVKDCVSNRVISAVDIFYRDELIFSKVEETETITSWFMCSPFRVDLLDPKDCVPTPVHYAADNYEDTCQAGLEQNMTLSWILIDPTRKRAVNLSSKRPVSVERHWLTGDVQVRFAAVVEGGNGRRGTAAELVECGVVVTCGRSKEGRVHVSEVSLSVEDMEGRNLSGRDSLIILQGAMEAPKRVSLKGEGKEGKERYEEFVKKKRERKQRKVKREMVMDTLCIVLGVSIFVMFWSVLLFRRR